MEAESQVLVNQQNAPKYAKWRLQYDKKSQIREYNSHFLCKTKPIFRKAQTSVSFFFTKDYENVPCWRLQKKQSQSKPNAGLWPEAQSTKYGILSKPNECGMTVLRARLLEHDYEKQSHFLPKGGRTQVRCQLIDWMRRILYYDIERNDKQSICGGDWCLVVPLVFKTSVGLRRSWVGSIPIRLRHYYRSDLE